MSAIPADRRLWLTCVVTAEALKLWGRPRTEIQKQRMGAWVKAEVDRRFPALGTVTPAVAPVPDPMPQTFSDW